MAAKKGTGRLVSTVVVDRLEPDHEWLSKTLGTKVRAQPLAATRFSFVIDAGTVGGLLAENDNKWIPPAGAAAALANAVRRTFIEELPGPAITFDSEGLEGEPATFSSNSGQMREDFVVKHHVKQVPLAPSTRIGQRFVLDAGPAGVEPVTVRAKDLRMENGRPIPIGVMNPETILAYLRPGEYLKVTGLVVTERSPGGRFPEHASVPRCGIGPVGVPEVPFDLRQVGAQTRPSEAEALERLAEVADEPYIPEELAASLKARVEKGDASFLVAEPLASGGAGETKADEGPGPSTYGGLVSLADAGKYVTAPSLTATGWRVVATAKALPAGRGLCQQLALKAAGYHRAQLQTFQRYLEGITETDERSSVRISAARTDGGETRLDIDAPEFSRTVGLVVCAFGGTPDATVSCKMLDGTLRITVAAPGGKDDALAVVKKGCGLALALVRALEKDIAKATERPAAADEKVTTLNCGV
jgi:hypothetical protein